MGLGMRIIALLVSVSNVAAAMVVANPALPGEGDECDGAQPDENRRVEVTQSATGHAWQPHAMIRLQTTAASVDALRFQQRLTGRRGPWELALLNERDPGEGNWHDHIVGYVQRSTNRFDVAAGSLRPAFGQGLLFGRGRSVGVPGPAPKRDVATLGYRSSAEARTIEGAAVRWRGAAWTAALLTGAIRWDARVDGEGNAVALPEDGDHSGSGDATRDRLHGRVVAGRWTRRLGRTDLGLSAQRLVFGRPVDLRRPETPYAYHGQGQSSAAADVAIRRGSVRWYATAARAGHLSAGLAGVSGLVAAGLRLDLLGRWYAAGLFVPLGAAASGADMDNEHGLTLQARGRRWRGWADVTQRPAPRWRQPLPTRRRAAGVHGETRQKPWRWSADLQQRSSSLWIDETPGRDSTTRARLQALRSQGSFRLVLRADGVHYERTLRQRSTEGSHGFAGSIALRWRRRRLRWDTLLSLFRTGAYAARIYEYEPQLPGAASIRPLYGEGARLVTVCGIRLGPVQMSARWRLYAVSTGVQHAAAVQIETAPGSR